MYQRQSDFSQYWGIPTNQAIQGEQRTQQIYEWVGNAILQCRAPARQSELALEARGLAGEHQILLEARFL